jgi:ketosteroid isomerase-like protein
MFGSTVYRGKDGVKAFFQEWYGAWEDMQNHPEELIDAGDDVVAVVTNRGRGDRSGVEVAMTHASVWTIHDGRVVRVRWLSTRAEALEAVGLAE